MTYSIIGIVSILVLLIINQDVIWKIEGRYNEEAHRDYRIFLFGILLYYATDALWGIFDWLNTPALLFADTTAYFTAMALTVLMWTQFVVAYLEESVGFGRMLLWTGRAFFAFQIVVLVINLFIPIMFYVDAAGEYHAEKFRYAALGIQMLMFLLTSIYSFRIMSKVKGRSKGRYKTIGLFGMAMILAIGLQIIFPLLSFYAIGYLLGSCLIHVFVIEDEKNEYREQLEELIEREKLKEIELGSARRLVYTDPMTGVKSKHSYTETEHHMDKRIEEGTAGKFAVIVFDLNDLKLINDTQGHDAGDEYIIEGCKMICDYFKHSPVYRMGGDEFVAVLQGSDYRNSKDILDKFNRHIEENMVFGTVVISAGMAEFEPGHDRDMHSVTSRADRQMYRRKEELKIIQTSSIEN